MKKFSTRKVPETDIGRVPSIPVKDFKSVFEAVPGLYLILKPDFTIAAVSDAYLAATMTKREDILGRGLFDVFPDNPNDKKATGTSNLRASLNHVLKHGEAHTMAVQKYDIRKPDGVFEERHWSPLNTPVFNAENELDYIIHNVVDVTPRKKSEEKFRALLEAAPDAMIIASEKGEIVLINRQTEKLFGYTKEELMGKRVEILIPATLQHKHIKHRENYVKDPHVRTMGAGMELEALKKGGIRFPVEISLSPLETEDGTLISASVRDISDRKRSEEKFRGLLEAAPDAMIIANDKGEIVLINQQTKILFGYKHNELIGKPVEILIPHSFRKHHEGHRNQYFNDPKVRSMGAGLELFAIRKDGSQFPVEISLSPLVTEEGTLVSASVRDITDRKRSEEKFRGLLEAAPDAMIIANDKGEIILINKQTEQLFGYSRTELLGKPVEILIPANFHAKHIGHRTKYFHDPKVRSMGAGLELFAIRKDGTQFPVEISLSPLVTEEGTLVSASVRDITDRKKAEEKFRSLLDAAPDATVIVNEKGLIQMINQQTENLFGYSRAELIGQPVEILIPPELHSKHVHHRGDFFKAAKVRTMGAGIELNAVRKNGVRFPVEISLSPIQTEEGMLVSASVRDISLRKELETELRKTNEELETFTYSVSHDLRAPLRGILGFTNILEEDYSSHLDHEAQRITSVIKNNTLKMGRLIDDLLAFARMGKQEILKSRVNMQTMVREVIDELVQQNKAPAIHWDIGSLPTVRADITTIRQVWINLISNAIKYSGNKEDQRIEIGSFNQEGHTVFFIKDNGVGFDEQYKNKLFKVFQRLHDSEEFEGTGVGLALVEKIISRHGGKVWADGKVNEGAHFYFSLPG